jgi:hypothetical protein
VRQCAAGYLYYRSSDLPEIAAETIREVLHEAGHCYQRTRTWVRTGYALRKRKSGTVTTYDEHTPEKNRRGKRTVWKNVVD